MLSVHWNLVVYLGVVIGAILLSLIKKSLATDEFDEFVITTSLVLFILLFTVLWGGAFWW